MSRVQNKRTGGLGMTLLLCVAAMLLGLGLDFATTSASRFWFSARPGALALFGAGVAIAVIGSTYLLRFVLRRRDRSGGTERHVDA